MGVVMMKFDIPIDAATVEGNTDDLRVAGLVVGGVLAVQVGVEMVRGSMTT